MTDRLAFDGFTLIDLRDPKGTFELELTVDAGRSEPYAVGDGYGHLAGSVADLEAEHARCSELCLTPTPIRTLEHDGAPLARVFFLTDPGG